MREGGECGRARARMLILLLKGEGKADYESTINDLKEPAPWAVASGHVTGNLSEPQSSTAFDLYRAALPSPPLPSHSHRLTPCGLACPLLSSPLLSSIFPRATHVSCIRKAACYLAGFWWSPRPPPALPLSPSMLIARTTKWTPCLAVSDSIAVVRWRLSID